jgi:hypothetical protein
MKFKIIGKGEMRQPVLLKASLMLIKMENGRKPLNFQRMLLNSSTETKVPMKFNSV